MKTKIYNFLTYSFLALFILYPLMIVFYSSKYMAFATFFSILVLIFINWKKINILDNKKTIYVIVLLTFLTRLIYVIKIDNNITQVSDFRNVFYRASLMKFNSNPSYYQTAYHYLLYTLFNGALYKVFGAHQLVTTVLNALVTSSASILIYKICYKILKNRAISNLASIIYLFWPSMTLYTAILSPDHFCLFFVLLSIYFIILIIDNLKKSESKKKPPYFYIVLIILSGISISLIGFFKNFSPVILLSLFITLFLICILNKKIIKTGLIIMAGIAGVYFLTNSIMFKIEEHILDAPIMKNQLGLYVWVGLGLPNQGLYSEERYVEYYEYLHAHNNDYKKTNAYFINKLMDEIKKDYGKYPNLLKNKAINSFSEDYGQISFLAESINKENYNFYNILTTNIRHLNNLFYIILLIFTLIASFYNIIYLKNNSLLFINIIFFGGCLMLLLAESQNRYKYALLPLLCIMSAVGIYYGYDLIKKIINQERNKVK